VLNSAILAVNGGWFEILRDFMEYRVYIGSKFDSLAVSTVAILLGLRINWSALLQH
jgi:hypothetical protein